jgi:uncharacterized protein YybS (DUF2232 family)
VGLFLLTSLAGLSLLCAAAYASYRWSWKALYALLPAIAAGLLFYNRLSATGPEVYAMLASSTIVGAAAGLTFRLRRPIQFFILTAALGATALYSANYYFLKTARGTDLFAQSRDRLVQYIQAAPTGTDQAKRDELLSQIDRTMEFIKDMVPFSYFLNVLTFSMLLFLVMRMALRKMSGGAITSGAGLEFFRLNDYMIFILIGGWLAFLLVEKSKFSALHTAGFNVALIFSFLYVIQALGIIKYYFLRKNLPILLLPLGIVFVLSFFTQFLLFLVIILASVGAIDFWADFRRFEHPGAGGDEQ